MESLPSRGLAIVGTRRASPRGLEATRALVRGLKGTGLVVVSGFAEGVDTAAHEAALQAGLPTVCVLGCGIDVDYPKSNRELRRRVEAGGGLILSEYADGSLPLGHHFLHRNRLIAALSMATVVVEAPARSGALSTARWARELGRDVYAVPCFPGDSRAAGNQLLLDRDHAHALWGTHSLGATWLELATHSAGAAPGDSGGTADARRLRMEGDRLLRRDGAVSDLALLESALSWGWDRERFFAALAEPVTRAARA